MLACPQRVCCSRPSTSTTYRFYSGKRTTQKYVHRQMTDEFARRAREHSYRARSAFKLLEMHKRFDIFRPGGTVVDVGAAPGSWSQVAVECVRGGEHKAFVLGVDLQMMLPIAGAVLLSQSDMTHSCTHEKIRRALADRHVDVLMSDMAPNPTGDRQVDHERIIHLCRTVFLLTRAESEGAEPVVRLARDALFLCKIWDGELRKPFMSELSCLFRSVRTVKPEACRDSSAELYLLASKMKA